MNFIGRQGTSAEIVRTSDLMALLKCITEGLDVRLGVNAAPVISVYDCQNY
jgi:hypothetical protein